MDQEQEPLMKALFDESESEDEEFEGFKKPEEIEGEKEDKDTEKDTEKDDQAEANVDADQVASTAAATEDVDSDDEDFEGFKKPDEGNEDDKNDQEKDLDSMDPAEIAAAAGLDDSSSDSDVDDAERANRSDIVYDFDIMMQKKREENYKRRKRKNYDIINDSDDMIAEIISQMKQAAEDDFEYNKAQKPATSKLNLLKKIEHTLKKIDFREALLDSGVLGVITDWLTPLPDRSLPNISIRTTMLSLLLDFNISDTERLKASGIGRAVMYLFKHPKETKENKEKARRLISAWSRPIFNNDIDHHSISREEREARDLDWQTKAKKSRVNSSTSSSEAASPVKKAQSDKGPQPGEKGWIPRARVPMPSTRDYVVRPQSLADDYVSRSSGKKIVSRFELMQRQFKEKKKASKVQRAVKISIEGRKM